MFLVTLLESYKYLLTVHTLTVAIFFTSIFITGPVDSEKTVFLQQSNTIVVTAGLYYSMEIIPKDCFGNVAIITQRHLTAEIRKVLV